MGREMSELRCRGVGEYGGEEEGGGGGGGGV